MTDDSLEELHKKLGHILIKAIRLNYDDILKFNPIVLGEICRKFDSEEAKKK
jgi:hypothetical protein